MLSTIVILHKKLKYPLFFLTEEQIERKKGLFLFVNS